MSFLVEAQAPRNDCVRTSSSIFGTSSSVLGIQVGKQIVFAELIDHV